MNYAVVVTHKGKGFWSIWSDMMSLSKARKLAKKLNADPMFRGFIFKASNCSTRSLHAKA